MDVEVLRLGVSANWFTHRSDFRSKIGPCGGAQSPRTAAERIWVVHSEAWVCSIEAGKGKSLELAMKEEEETITKKKKNTTKKNR